MKQKKFKKANSVYSTGIPGIDKQHQDLFLMCNALCDRLENETLSVEDSVNSLEGIVKCLKSHFATEQSLLDMIGFSGIKEHKKDHEKLCTRFMKEIKALENKKHVDVHSFIIESRDILFNHVAVLDREYADFTEELISLRKKYKITALKARVLVD